jgi:carbon storage regulator
MLVIRRRAGESLVVGGPEGERVEVEVLDIEGSQVKLGIRAPRHVRVLRSEIEATENANRLAAGTPLPAILDQLSARLRTAQTQTP